MSYLKRVLQDKEANIRRDKLQKKKEAQDRENRLTREKKTTPPPIPDDICRMCGDGNHERNICAVLHVVVGSLPEPCGCAVCSCLDCGEPYAIAELVTAEVELESSDTVLKKILFLCGNCRRLVAVFVKKKDVPFSEAELEKVRSIAAAGVHRLKSCPGIDFSPRQMKKHGPWHCRTCNHVLPWDENDKATPHTQATCPSWMSSAPKEGLTT